MNDERRFEREVAATITERAPTHAPDHLLPSVIYNASRRRRDPRWLALIKEPPMRTSNNVAVGSPTARVAAILVATLLLALTIAGAGVAGSRLLAADASLVVDPTGAGTHATLASAVADAADDDTILVKPGTYDESVVITKDITIRGDGDRDDIVIEVSAELEAFATGFEDDLPEALRFESSDAVVENLTFRGESSRIIIVGGAPTLRELHLDGLGRVWSVDPGGNSVPGGLDILENSRATIEDSILADMGANIETGSSPLLRGNTITVGGIWMEGAGVEPTIIDNDIDSQQPWGIAVWAGARPLIVGNTIKSAGAAIDLQDRGFVSDGRGPDPIIRDNTMMNSWKGVSAPIGTKATIDGNRFEDNDTAMTLVTPDVSVTGNVVRGGRTGILTSGDGEARFEDNDVEGVEGRGMAIMRGSPILSGNRICGNDRNLVVAEERADPGIDESNEICPDIDAID